MFSRVAKQGLLALGRENNETHCSGSDKSALPGVLVGMKSLHQLRFRKKRQTNIAGTKPVTSKQMRNVKKQRGPASGKNYSITNTVGLEKVVSPIPYRKIKAPTTFNEPMNKVAVNPILDVPTNERVSGTKCVLRAAGDGRFKARVVPLDWNQRQGTDRAIVAAKDKFGHSRNGALDKNELSTQHYGVHLGKVFRCSSQKSFRLTDNLAGKNDMT